MIATILRGKDAEHALLQAEVAFYGGLEGYIIVIPVQQLAPQQSANAVQETPSLSLWAAENFSGEGVKRFDALAHAPRAEIEAEDDQTSWTKS